MKHGSLFSGIGGFDLAAEWMGWQNEFHCEWNPFGQKVLKYYWPNAKSYGDITKTDFTIHRGSIDIITGGFPCQPFSSAGKRKGKDDDRYLWPEMLRVIGEVKPRWVIGENVAGITSMVQSKAFETYMENQTTIENEDNQEITTEKHEYIIETICKDLEHIGYSVQPIVIPACASGAPHRRDRIWFIAHSDNLRVGKPKEPKEQQRGAEIGTAGKKHDVPYSKSQSGGRELLKQPKKRQSGRCNSLNESGYWENFPTEQPVCIGNDGIPAELDGITFSKWRNESIKAGGNAIVPQVALQIFKAIEQYEKLL